MKVTRNDSILIQLKNYGFFDWIGKEKDGKAFYTCFNSKGKGFTLFTIDFDEPDTTPITAEIFMQNEYRQNADTLRTYYVPGL